ncbi:uncharacterized protein F5Z01DRAFT_309381 [Emericellopsis atlantica]|uniref:SWI5-dependent HO expression protein 3 n=1 Tax=Emericellopsis atlantica TaxID=2614577 RepID=A0A9P7ZUB4_9HYPO|nr:uncharacterized protein F5Z01DRAFT_309381 [Emericellopsis atlantica]KAG9257912.1 hypothetical protein F5Z01DRAFT_309381 [Emericellopsis atlantica]
MRHNRLFRRAFDIHHDAAAQSATHTSTDTDLNEPTPGPLSTASPGSVNSMKSPVTTAPKAASVARSSTIRSVRSRDFDSSPQSKESVLSSSVQSHGTNASEMAAPQIDRSSPSVRLKHEGPPEPASRWNSHAGNVRVVDAPTPGAGDSSMLSEGVDGGDAQWDSTVGKAGLGKTGRVINKLVSDNDALKRDINIERLRAEESKQAAKLLEDKMDRMVQDYESRLLEANVTKTLLARKERQVESLQAAVELEKNKTQAALTRERGWRDELEKVQKDSTTQVEEATTHAALMEGRYNAISSHWRDQGEEVKRAVAKLRAEISSLVKERQVDDTKIQTLRDLCEQQDSNINELRREKEQIARKFEEYKKTQDDDLKSIKVNARETEAEQQRILNEAGETLNKLRWALNVKKNVKGAR